MRPTGTLYGPYARQIVNGRLKLWFCILEDSLLDNTFPPLRYEMLLAPSLWPPPVRARHSLMSFKKYAVPKDLSMVPSTRYPRFPKDNMAAALLSILKGEDLASVAATRIGLTADQIYRRPT